MADRKVETVKIISQECLAEGIYSMWIETEGRYGKARTVLVDIHQRCRQAPSKADQYL